MDFWVLFHFTLAGILFGPGASTSTTPPPPNNTDASTIVFFTTSSATSAPPTIPTTGQLVSTYSSSSAISTTHAETATNHPSTTTTAITHTTLTESNNATDSPSTNTTYVNSTTDPPSNPTTPTESNNATDSPGTNTANITTTTDLPSSSTAPTESNNATDSPSTNITDVTITTDPPSTPGTSTESNNTTGFPSTTTIRTESLSTIPTATISTNHTDTPTMPISTITDSLYTTTTDLANATDSSSYGTTTSTTKVTITSGVPSTSTDSATPDPPNTTAVVTNTSTISHTTTGSTTDQNYTTTSSIATTDFNNTTDPPHSTPDVNITTDLPSTPGTSTESNNATGFPSTTTLRTESPSTIPTTTISTNHTDASTMPTSTITDSLFTTTTDLTNATDSSSYGTTTSTTKVPSTSTDSATPDPPSTTAVVTDTMTTSHTTAASITDQNFTTTSSIATTDFNNTTDPPPTDLPSTITTTVAPTSTGLPSTTTTPPPQTHSTQYPNTTTTSTTTSTGLPSTTTTTSSQTHSTQYSNTSTTSATTSTGLPSTTTTTSSQTHSTQYSNTSTTSATTSAGLPSTTTTTSSQTHSTQYSNTSTTSATTSTGLPNTTTTPSPQTHSTPYSNTSTTSATTSTGLPSTTTPTSPQTHSTQYPNTTAGTVSTTTTSTVGSTVITTTSPLVCDNGGELLDGVCICPDEWIGQTCSDENFCKEQSITELNFPQTPIGWFAYSKEVCPKDSNNAGKPQASTLCYVERGAPTFKDPQFVQCDQTLSDIQQNLTTQADLESLATSTQILTSRPEELTAENITTAAQIANTLLLSANATESIRVAAVATVSQLLNASAPEDVQDNSATLNLTVTLDQLSVNLSAIQNGSTSQVVQPNLVIQSAQILDANTQGVQFTSLTGTSGSFVADRIRLNTNTSLVVVDNGFIADALVYIKFPPAVRQNPSNVSLGFVLYQNDRFFKSNRYRRQRATIRVLSANVRGQERAVVPQHVELLFRPTTVPGTVLFDFACAFWNYSLNDWSTDGCSKGNTSDGILRCFCNHTTNFAALWSFREKYEYAEALGVISIVGLAISMLCLLITIIHHIKENCQRKTWTGQISKIAFLSICFSLLAFILTFLIGVENPNKQSNMPEEISNQTNSVPPNDKHVQPDSGPCTAVTALLHFFLLSTFGWNAVYGTQLVQLFQKNSASLPDFCMPLSIAIGWGLPAGFVAITLGATYRINNPLGYRQEEFCWLAALDESKNFDFGKPMFWGFILPVGLILIYNIVLLILSSMTICRTNPILNSTNHRSVKKKICISFSLGVILGLSWTLGYLVLTTTGHANLVFSIIFCLCTTTQGLQIFILFTARKPSFRAGVLRSAQYVSIKMTHFSSMKYTLHNIQQTASTELYRDLTDEKQEASK